MQRRTFIKGIGAGAVSLMLGGCGDDKSPLSAIGGDKVEEPKTEFKGQVETRELPRGNGIKISTIGLGVSAMKESNPAQLERMVSYALDQGINYFDTVMSNLAPAAPFAKAIKGKRDKFYIQTHIGAAYPGDGYMRTRDLNLVKDGLATQFKAFGIDYSDVGMIHYVDDMDDYQQVMDNGLLDYALQLKKEGKIRMVGLSSHSVDVARRFVATNNIDVLMFSMNPAYDFEPGTNGLQMIPERKALYEECQKAGTAITIMKVFGGGKLLGNESPFGKPMTPAQCFQYGLDRPAVASCIAGVGNMSELEATLKYYETSKEERDYSFVFKGQESSMNGICIYCDHCLPCPMNIDIGVVMKYYDLAKAGDKLAKEHYMSLPRTAGDCTGCKECEPRCPFKVKVVDRMNEIKGFFGR